MDRSWTEFRLRFAIEKLLITKMKRELQDEDEKLEQQDQSKIKERRRETMVPIP